MTDWPGAQSDEHVHLPVGVDLSCFEDEGAAALAIETLTALCFEAGAAGVEERIAVDSEGAVLASAGRVELVVYAPRIAVASIVAAVASHGLGEVGEAVAVEPVDWSNAWQAGFDAIEVCDALVIRPSFVSVDPKPGRREIVIDPGQAFGTGGHQSTHLVLDTIRDCSAGFSDSTRVLDVGTGTGVLAFAALALGARRAVGFDLDPLAAREARGFARANGFEADFDVFAGGIEALASGPFELVLANLLRREMLPIAPQLSAFTAPGGELVLSGLLDSERAEVEAAFEPFGLSCRRQRSALDDNGDRWISLVMARA